MKHLVHLVLAVHVYGIESSLKQNACRKVASLSHLTMRGNPSVTAEFTKARSQVIHRDVHRSRNVTAREFLLSSNIQQERALVGDSAGRSEDN